MSARPTNEATRHRETWIDWDLPVSEDPADLLTRDELLQMLRDQRVLVSRDDLRNWQSAGIIPYPVNRWHDGAVRSLYPHAMATVLRTIRSQQADGHKLPAIRETVRSIFRDRTAPFVTTVPVATAIVAAPSPTVRIRLHRFAQGRARKPVSAERTLEIALPPELLRGAAALARTTEAALGTHYPRAELHLIDEAGDPLVFTLEIQPA